MYNQDILCSFRKAIENVITFNDREWDIVRDFLIVKRLLKNQCFAEAGKTCKELGFIIDGGVRYCSIVDGKEVTGYFSFQNHFVTALKSYLNAEPCQYDIKTLDETTFVTISKTDMETMYKHPVIGCKIERLGRLIAESFNLLFEDRLKSFIVKTPEERYLDLLRSGNEIVNRIPIQYVAQYIGITPVSLSRIRKRILEKSAI